MKKKSVFILCIILIIGILMASFDVRLKTVKYTIKSSEITGDIKLAGGIYDFEGKKLIVSRGLAKESTRLPRIFNRPELVFVSLITE